jgi:hypothetical protein
MVVTFLLPTIATGIRQERAGTPSTCTVQAPHWPAPQPYLVPTKPSVSRRAHSSGVSSSTSTARGLPLMLRVYLRMSVLA